MLFLDGFDEIQADRGREEILNQICQELKQMNCLKKFSLIITCRENYVHESGKIKCDCITLQAWDELQIESFCKVYGSAGKSSVSESEIRRISENKEVFGIPIILYMTLALGITMEADASVVGVYDRFFSLNRGGIYDRCIDNLDYGEVHRIGREEIKMQIHQISKRIAFWMFEKNSQEAFIGRKEYEKICDNVADEISGGSEDIKRDFLIGNFF